MWNDPMTVPDADPPRHVTARPLTPGVCEHAEGPVWDVRAGVLRYVDMLRGDVMTYRPDGDLARIHVADVVAALRPRRDGGWVLALERDIAVTEPGTWVPRTIATVIDGPGIRFNDGGCDAAGGFLCGTMAYDKSPGTAELFRLAPDGSVTRIFGDVTISNGFCLDPTGSLAYYVDTPTARIDVFDVGADGSTLSNRRPFVAIEPGAGFPDGLTVDADGGVWVALFGGGAVRGYGPDGRLQTIVDIATPDVTACAFGGPGMRDLYITTTQERVRPPDEPLAGALFHVVPGPVGLPPRPYAG
jgi:sugar lactone lactonase YvrE